MRARGAALGLALVVAASAASAQLEVANAWVREPPPGASAAAFMTIENTGSTPRRIVAVESPACERAEIHRTVLKAGVARMERLETLDLAPGASVVLAPRALHLMLIRPAKLRVGQTISITLHPQRGDAVRVEAVVAKRRPASSGGAHHGPGRIDRPSKAAARPALPRWVR